MNGRYSDKQERTSSGCSIGRNSGLKGSVSCILNAEIKNAKRSHIQRTVQRKKDRLHPALCLLLKRRLRYDSVYSLYLLDTEHAKSEECNGKHSKKLRQTNRT